MEDMATCICLFLIMDLFVLSRHIFPYSSKFVPWGFMSNLCSTFPSTEILPKMKAKVMDYFSRAITRERRVKWIEKK